MVGTLQRCPLPRGTRAPCGELAANATRGATAVGVETGAGAITIHFAGAWRLWRC